MVLESQDEDILGSKAELSQSRCVGLHDNKARPNRTGRQSRREPGLSKSERPGSHPRCLLAVGQVREAGQSFRTPLLSYKTESSYLEDLKELRNLEEVKVVRQNRALVWATSVPASRPLLNTPFSILL